MHASKMHTPVVSVGPTALSHKTAQAVTASAKASLPCDRPDSSALQHVSRLSLLHPSGRHARPALHLCPRVGTSLPGHPGAHSPEPPCKPGGSSPTSVHYLPLLLIPSVQAAWSASSRCRQSLARLSSEVVGAPLSVRSALSELPLSPALWFVTLPQRASWRPMRHTASTRRSPPR
jgi:hypothetical protein